MSVAEAPAVKIITVAEAAEKLGAARKVMVTCHLSPDGDALGSMSSLAALLHDNGREVVLYNPDPAPRYLRWLPYVQGMQRGLSSQQRFDLTVVVDCGDKKLLGTHFPSPEVTGPLLVLDHHLASRPFGDAYLCDPQASSVGVLVARLAKHLGWEPSREAALGIYVSIVSDTGGFRYANTNAEAFQLAAGLVSDRGVQPWEIARTMNEQVPLVRYRLLAVVLGGIQLELDGRIAVMVVTDEMVRGAGAEWEHTEGLVNYARAIENVECGVLLSPARDGGTRVSLRSKGKIDAGAICAPLGGGGHPGAAGCVVDATLPETRVTILAALAAALAAPPKTAA